MAKTNFRLYSDDRKSKLRSTVFDLISGNKETKQTKGLAYAFSLHPDLQLNSRKNLLNYPKDVY